MFHTIPGGQSLILLYIHITHLITLAGKSLHFVRKSRVRSREVRRFRLFGATLVALSTWRALIHAIIPNDGKNKAEYKAVHLKLKGVRLNP